MPPEGKAGPCRGVGAALPASRVAHLTVNYVQDTLARCRAGLAGERDSDPGKAQLGGGRRRIGGPPGLLNVLAKKGKMKKTKKIAKAKPLASEAKKHGDNNKCGGRGGHSVGIILQAKAGGNGGGGAWEVTVASFKSCCLAAVLVAPTHMRDFVRTGAIVRYRSAPLATLPPGVGAGVVNGFDFKLLDVLQGADKAGGLSGEEVLSAWARQHFECRRTHIHSIGAMAPAELALVKARVALIRRVEIRVAAPGTAPAAGRKGEFYMERKDRSRSSNTSANQKGKGNSATRCNVSLLLDIDDCTGKARCVVSSPRTARDLLALVDPERAAAIFDFCLEISDFYRRDFTLVFEMMGKVLASYKLRTPDHVELSYPMYKKLFKRLLSLCAIARDAAALNLLCRRCPKGQKGSQPRGQEAGKGDLFLQILQHEKTSSLYESLKHTLS